jgi:hypothetical protein
MRTALILPVLALAACTSAEPDRRGVDRDEVLLQVSASGRADSRPDEARFSAGVETIAGSAAEASTRNAATINRVLAAVEALGVKKDDFRTRSVTLRRIDYGSDKGKFQAHNVIEVRVRNMDKAGEAIAAATQAGANILSGPNLTVSDPEAASRSAYAQAYKAARARADAYAEAAGLKVARVLAIRDAGHTGRGGDYEMMAPEEGMATAVSAPPPPPIRGGMQQSEVQVRAEFALARK